MSTSAVSSSSLYQQLQHYFGVRHSDLNQLGKALSNGDLAGAQKVYNNIVALGQKGPVANGNPFINNQREQDFTGAGVKIENLRCSVSFTSGVVGRLNPVTAGTYVSNLKPVFRTLCGRAAGRFAPPRLGRGDSDRDLCIALSAYKIPGCSYESPVRDKRLRVSRLLRFRRRGFCRNPGDLASNLNRRL